MLQYVVGTGDDERRFSVLVYDAQKIQVTGKPRAACGRYGGQCVWAERRVYSVAAAQRAGVGYLLAKATSIRTRNALSWPP